MNMMKRILCTLLTLLLMAIPLESLTATAQSSGDEDILTQSYMVTAGLAAQEDELYSQDVVWDGDICYAYLNDMSVRTYRPNGAVEMFCRLPDAPENFYLIYRNMSDEETAQLENTVTYIVAYNNTLYGYNIYNGKFGNIDENGIHWGEITLDLSCLRTTDSFFPDRVARSFLTDQRLYTFVSLTEPDTYSDTYYAFYGFDLATGKAAEYEVPCAYGACHYQGDSFLFLRFVNDEYVLSCLDADTGTLTDLSIPMDVFPIEYEAGGLAYDANTDTICLAANGKVYRSIAGGDFEDMADIATNYLMTETPGWLLSDGRYVLWLDGVHIRAEGSRIEAVKLVISGGINYETQSAFQKAHPNIMLAYSDTIGSEELAKKFAAKDSGVDIYRIAADYTYTSLVDKGLAVDLSSSSIIADDVGGMYEWVQDVLRDDKGRIMAYPEEMNIWYYGINAGYWEMLFGDRPLPTTFDDVMDAWIEWEMDYAEQYPGVGFIGDNFDYARLCRQLVTIYVMRHDSADAPPDVTAASLRSVLEKLRQVYEIRVAAGRSTTGDVPDKQLESYSETGPGMIFYIVPQTPMQESSITTTTSSEYLYGVRKGKMTWLPLVFDEDDAQKLDAKLCVRVVNPYSEHIEEAVQFIEWVSQVENNPYVYYAVHPQMNEPYEDPDYDRRTAWYAEEKQALEQAIEKTKAAGEDTTDFQYKLDYYNAWFENQEQQRWLISEESIRRYRSMMADAELDLHANSPYISGDGSIAAETLQSLCKQYADGRLTLDAFLNELSRKMHMIYLEDN